MTSIRGFRCRPASVPAARRFARELLSEHPSEIVDAVELMVSELATNSVRHAHTDFELEIGTREQAIQVEVRDTGQGRPVPRSPAAADPSGRGLRIVEAMSDTWGVTLSPKGKTVWFTLMRCAAARDETPTSAATDKSEAPGEIPPAGHRPAAHGAYSAPGVASACRWVRAKATTARAAAVAIQIACGPAARLPAAPTIAAVR